MIGENCNVKERFVIPTEIQLSAASRLFSSAVIKEMSKKGESALFSRLLREVGVSGLIGCNARVADAFDAVFSSLRAIGNRDEYIYKAALTHKILLGTHSLNTASMLTEFRVGSSRADLVILNGTATVYEIKSERDSLKRLDSQLEAYRQVFAQVCVIASEEFVDRTLQLSPSDVGVLALGSRHRITTVRKPQNAPDRVSPIALFETLRINEAKQILINLGIEVPNVPNTQLHSAMRSEFSCLEPAVVHAQMVRVLKETRSLVFLGELLEKLPHSLHAAALTMNVPKKLHGNLISAVNTPLERALGWL